MKVRLLKNHVNAKAGDVINVSEARGNYFLSVGVAEEETKKAVAKTVTKKEVKKPVKKAKKK